MQKGRETTHVFYYNLYKLWKPFFFGFEPRKSNLPNNLFILSIRINIGNAFSLKFETMSIYVFDFTYLHRKDQFRNVIIEIWGNIHI